MNTTDLLIEAEKALIPIFSGIDTQVKQNLKKFYQPFAIAVLESSILPALAGMDTMIWGEIL